jgi:hypothetical protein
MSTCSAHCSLLDFTMLITLEDSYKPRSSSLYNFLNCQVHPTQVQIFYLAICYHILVIYILPSKYDTTFHTPTKQMIMLHIDRLMINIAIVSIFCSQISTCLKSDTFSNDLLHMILLSQFHTIMREIHTTEHNDLRFCINTHCHNHLP